jgi:hypothetical protein
MTDKAAINYLAQSGAAAICIIGGETGCAFRAGLTGPGDIAATY